MNTIARVYLLHLVRDSELEYWRLPLTSQKDVIAFAAAVGATLPTEPGMSYSDVLQALYAADPDSLVRLESERLAFYRELSTEQGRELARQVMDIWKADPDIYDEWTEDILLHLTCMVSGAARGLHNELLVERGVHHWELYRDADTEVRERLIQRVETDHGHGFMALYYLAYLGDDEVQAEFHRWRESPPTEHDIPERIEEATRKAGWELTKTGRRRLLYHRECYGLVSVDAAHEEDLTGPVSVIFPHEAQCDWCGWQLTTMLDLDLQDARLGFLAPGWTRLRIATCERCRPFGTVFTEVDGEGKSLWSDFNTQPDRIGDDDTGWRLPERRLGLGPRRRSPFEAHVHIMEHGTSQIGGYPSWVQDTTDSGCPKCGRGMVFVGQVETSDAAGEPKEGTTYAFLCQECGLAATAYEQT